jgi:hypothetical protein
MKISSFYIANLLKNPDIDLKYLHFWTNQLNLNTFGLLNP